VTLPSGGTVPAATQWMNAEMNAPEPEDDKRAIWTGIALLIVLMVIAGEVFAAQPAPDATQSVHLYFLENLLVVIFAFFFCLIGAAHGYKSGATNDGRGG
jgi:hypothetical protein